MEKIRCGWVKLDSPLYIEYHDTEWGIPKHNERDLFELLILEGAQAGLSWLTVLKKREGYREAFDNFDVKKVAKYNGVKIEELMNNSKIIRNRRKIEASIQNAKVFLEIQKEFGSFDAYIWGFTEGKIIKNHFKNLNEIPSKTLLSDSISKDLQKRGMKFVGTTIIYAFLQASGIVNDHLQSCFCYQKKYV